MDKLETMFDKQFRLQNRLENDTKSIEYQRVMILALHCELSELLQELPWKPWKQSNKPINEVKVKEEIADCWHFLINITLPFMGSEETFEQFMAKNKINHERQNQKY